MGIGNSLAPGEHLGCDPLAKVVAEALELVKNTEGLNLIDIGLRNSGGGDHAWDEGGGYDA